MYRALASPAKEEYRVPCPFITCTCHVVAVQHNTPVAPGVGVWGGLIQHQHQSWPSSRHLQSVSQPPSPGLACTGYRSILLHGTLVGHGRSILTV